MKLYKKQTLLAIMLTSTVAFSIPSAFAADGTTAPTAVEAPAYAINGSIQTQVKSVLLEKTENGWKMGVVIKLNNRSGAAVRTPDFELRAKGSDGTLYLLQPSAANIKSIAPHTNEEFSYMAEVDSTVEINLTDLILVDFDMSVYPKQETVLADIGIGSMVWKGNDSRIADTALLNWGDPFRLPGVSSSLVYSAASLYTQFDGQAPTYIVQLKVENPGSHTETVPGFSLSGKADGQSFLGKRMDETPLVVIPGESHYVYYSIPMDAGVNPEAFYVLTTESFVKLGQTTAQTYSVGGVGFRVPAQEVTELSLPAYQLGSRIAIDPMSKAINPQLSVSLSNADWFENEGQSFKTVVANVKFTNFSDSPLPIPAIGADLMNHTGVVYSGSQLESSVKEVLPGMGVAATYAFTMPLTESADQFTFRLLEKQGESGFQTPIGKLPVAIQKATPNATDLDFYPYKLKLNSWGLSMVLSQNATTKINNYTYRMKSVMDISTTDNVVTEASNPKLLIELENPAGERIGYKTFELTGPNRLINGNQMMYFDNVVSDLMESPLKVKIFETVTTPLGEAKRLLSVLEQ
ncbi:hypothetical protein [Paenibacillus agricola]|uniref:DUF4352 domain-containing protein n=1 Tax=Paenibacillus agricola TaxID=2716264 RepID=A0ABX0J6H5_9BACL|nr:hypothetical protein [Paenibacillus agricola]NHN29666.1 hypothetical protein [Paenibacillus agricola]